MRLYTPVPVLKWNHDYTQAITTDLKFWGSDSLDWRPSRWIKSTAGTDGGVVEEFSMPVPCGAFIGWSEGTRDCVGRKFSQVEFVAIMAVLFRNWRVNPVVLAGETPEEARRRVICLIETDSYAVLLLQMLYPERAPLVWRKV
ncbi:cytochrome P450 [Apiospora arundinis]|uniref:Cytochrome P450 n=1 Tax=Apiospora arundinis TaxID=335852 RepID=A0ABR2I056_9PEZI